MMIDRIKNHITLKFSMAHHVNVLKTKEIKCIVTEFKKKIQLTIETFIRFFKVKMQFSC